MRSSMTKHRCCLSTQSGGDHDSIREKMFMRATSAWLGTCQSDVCLAWRICVEHERRYFGRIGGTKEAVANRTDGLVVMLDI